MPDRAKKKSASQRVAKKTTASRKVSKRASLSRSAAGREPSPTAAPPRDKRSVTLDAEVAEAVDRHVERGAADSFSAAINEAAWRWAANQDLGEVLDEIYEEDPSARPSEEAIEEAARRLGMK